MATSLWAKVLRHCCFIMQQQMTPERRPDRRPLSHRARETNTEARTEAAPKRVRRWCPAVASRLPLWGALQRYNRFRARVYTRPGGGRMRRILRAAVPGQLRPSRAVRRGGFLRQRMPRELSRWTVRTARLVVRTCGENAALQLRHGNGGLATA